MALTRNAEIDAENVNVSADGGKVTLSGSVRSLAQREKVEKSRPFDLRLGTAVAIPC